MDYIDLNFNKEDDHIILISKEGEEKKIKLEAIKNVYTLKESKTSPIYWYHKLLMGIFLTAFVIFSIYKSLKFLDSGTLDLYPTLSNVLFFIVLIYTILALIAIALMVAFGISGETRFISYFALRKIKTRKRNCFVIKTARKEYKILIKSRRQKGHIKLKINQLRVLLND